ncbi:MAG: bifunctional demethylmenaquinone methyltransferase/2-methoxy-6-polyprenyl-1,4-benzoquinol methylase UbiE [Flavobacteriales bacterium]|jgi:demethylmenaquinone methyltransferase/2-methoxy-6-polyprenyl-1,4-benzoquinol methylase|nr:bifunctional demethylmenaquinone methyltransferase/2-methoxy-6-polyprenyl-1,4-benzoquinol methylase UbiE [Flavobacteriales bacterium]
MTVTPYANDGSKREQVERMFDRISPRYDLLNRLLSLGIDQRWRRRVVRRLGRDRVQHLLDVATGTGDLAIMAAGRVPRVTGADISAGMLEQGRRKVAARGLQDRITLQQADSVQLPWPDGTFDAVTVAFGVRNFAELERGIAEMRRVLRPGGMLHVLEFSKPRRTPFKQLFRFYFHRVMPFVGRLVSRDPAAYTYLPESVEAFPEGPAFVAILARCGFHEAHAHALTGGVATHYTARK